MSNIITCEQVSSGHPDKICDQIADAVVSDCLKHDKRARVAIEVLVKDNHIVIAGELTSLHAPDYPKLVDEVFSRIGKGRLGYDAGNFELQILVSQQSPAIAQGVDVGGASRRRGAALDMPVRTGGHAFCRAMIRISPPACPWDPRD